jgi:hypothetical protein
MWRSHSSHERSETEYLDQAIKRIETDEHLRKHADAAIDAAAHQEPLFAQGLSTPQDVRYHAEGPYLRDHLQLMLMGLFAIEEGKLHLIDIEEFRRVKGYEGELEELEEIIKEKFSFFKAFILCHDVAKFVAMTFSSPVGSKGEQLGFNTPRLHQFDEIAHERVKMREEYLRLYNEFAKANSGESPADTQAQFYLTYQINVHYPHHSRKIHAPVYLDFLDRFCVANELPENQHALLEDMIVHHMEFNTVFNKVSPSQIGRFIHLANKRGYDADDFLDVMQGCLFLDAVLGSKRLAPHGYWHDSEVLMNCLKSEHDWTPWRRGHKLKQLEKSEKRRRLAIFKEVGLDGISLMDLLELDPGPEFGITLRRIHAAAQGKGDMPSFGKDCDRVIEERMGEYYKRLFKQGE